MRGDRGDGDPERREEHRPDRSEEKDDDARDGRGADQRLPLRELPPVDHQRGSPHAEKPRPARSQQGHDGEGGGVDGHGRRGDAGDDEAVVDAEVGSVLAEAARRLYFFFFFYVFFLIVKFLIRDFFSMRERSRAGGETEDKREREQKRKREKKKEKEQKEEEVLKRERERKKKNEKKRGAEGAPNPLSLLVFSTHPKTRKKAPFPCSLELRVDAFTLRIATPGPLLRFPSLGARRLVQERGRIREVGFDRGVEVKLVFFEKKEKETPSRKKTDVVLFSLFRLAFSLSLSLASLHSLRNGVGKGKSSSSRDFNKLSYLCEVGRLGERRAVGELRPRLCLGDERRRRRLDFPCRREDRVLRGRGRGHGIETLGHAVESPGRKKKEKESRREKKRAREESKKKKKRNGAMDREREAKKKKKSKKLDVVFFCFSLSFPFLFFFFLQQTENEAKLASSSDLIWGSTSRPISTVVYKINNIYLSFFVCCCR